MEARSRDLALQSRPSTATRIWIVDQTAYKMTANQDFTVTQKPKLTAEYLCRVNYYQDETCFRQLSEQV
jgi:hypothetical protein